MTMRVWVVALLLALLALGAAHAADPLRGRRAESAATAEAPAPGWIAPLVRWQRELNASISSSFRRVQETGSFAALLGILGIAFLYGVLHAAGPGHGKMVVAAYLTTRRDRWLAGVGVGGLISLIQGLSAVLGVGLLGWLLHLGHRQMIDRSVWIELVSYLLIAVIGLAMLWRAATGRHHEGHHHGPADHHHHDHAHDHVPQRHDWRFILVAGLTPCASAIIIMLFALANEAFWLGALAVAALSLGMGGTVAAIGVATVLARNLATRVFAAGGARGEVIERVMLLLGSFLLALFGGVLALGAWVRLS